MSSHTKEVPNGGHGRSDKLTPMLSIDAGHFALSMPTHRQNLLGSQDQTTCSNDHSKRISSIYVVQQGHSVHAEGHAATATDGARALRTLGGMVFCEPWHHTMGTPLFLVRQSTLVFLTTRWGVWWCTHIVCGIAFRDVSNDKRQWHM